MADLTLSRTKFIDFLACRRRFELRYLQRLPWPVGGLSAEAQEARLLGARFHQVLQRHFLDLPVADEVKPQPELGRWMDRFLKQGPALPSGRRYPEMTLTVPLDRHLLTGRFDLLVVGEALALIIDWKTEARPPTETQLRSDLQSRLYLALAAEGLVALGYRFEPEQISLLYWFANDPAAAVTLAYDRQQHEQNWSELLLLTGEIDALLAAGEAWPLTGDLSQCERCAYRLYCGRQGAATDLSAWEPDEWPPSLEPETP